IGEILGIETCEVMAFGDGENDLDMLRTVGHPVAMENSQEIVKNEIKNRAIPNTEEGVAKYIEEYFKF
ncbi:HAD family hydrolase, partial [Fusobacterium sp.]